MNLNNMLQKNKFKHTSEINSTFKEINDWLKELKFQECFRNQTNSESIFHWIKNGVRICLNIEIGSSFCHKYIVIHNDVLVFGDCPFGVKSMKYSIEQKEQILKIHSKFARMTFGFINESELHETYQVKPEKVRDEINQQYNILCHKYRKLAQKTPSRTLADNNEAIELNKQLLELEEKYPEFLK